MDSFLSFAGIAEVWQALLSLKAALLFAWSVLGGSIDSVLGLAGGLSDAFVSGFKFSVKFEDVLDDVVTAADTFLMPIVAIISALTGETEMLKMALRAEFVGQMFKQLGEAGNDFADRCSKASAVVWFILSVYTGMFVVLKGFRLMRGMSSGSLPEFFVETLKLMAIASFAGVATRYEMLAPYLGMLQNVLANLIAGSSDGVVNMGSVGKEGLNNQDVVQKGLSLLLKIAFFGAAMMGNTLAGTATPDAANNSSQLVTFAIIAMPMIGGALSFVVSTLSVLLLCKLAWGFLIGLGPLFIFSLAFKFTSSLFRSWFNNLLYVILLAALTTWLVKYLLLPMVLLQFLDAMGLALKSIQSPNIGGQSMGLIVSMQAGVVGMLTAIVTGFIPRLVGALTNTNAVSGFESMGAMLGGSMEKAGSSMQTAHKERQRELKDDAAKADAARREAEKNGGQPVAAYGNPQKDTSSGTNLGQGNSGASNGNDSNSSGGRPSSPVAAQNNGGGGGGGGGGGTSSPGVRDNGSQVGTGGRLASDGDANYRSNNNEGKKS